MKQRIITAVIAAAVFLPIVMYGGIPLTILLFIMATIGLHELLKMHKLPTLSVSSIIGFLMLWAILLPAGDTLSIGDWSITKANTVLIGAIFLLICTVISKNRFTFDDVGFIIISVLYVGVGFYYINATRDEGLFYIFFVLFTLWATDSGAYFVGRAIGKNKLWPEISPNKTIEGAVGGIGAALIIALIFSFATDMDASLLKLLVNAIVIAIFGQLGDLVQSAFKRHYGVKDAGNLLPGHGGVLDRTDSWIFVFPILHLFQLI
ncbi:phosphatidate cytidylyltransferase [Bacillus sp. JJ722]|uniref:phosphatidate cytidylyltransferase n=1 Tax=Bacillus sp. JJ722 TaxID=3122973 RepID=UPI002FFF8010